MKIEKYIFEEIEQDENPWQYFIIHWKFNRLELANLILKSGEFDIDNHHYNYEFIRHLSSKKYSIRIYSNHLRFDHSKYFDKNVVYKLKEEFNLERFFIINLTENYYIFMMPDKIQQIQDFASRYYQKRKVQSFEYLQKVKERVILERSNEALIKKLKARIVQLESDQKYCNEHHMEKEKYEKYVANCQATHSLTSDLNSQINRGNKLQELLDQEKIYKPMYFDMKQKFENLEKVRDKMIIDHQKQVEDLKIIIKEKEQNLIDYKIVCSEIHVLKTDYEKLQEKFEIKYWLVTNLEVQMHKFEYERMKSAYQMLSERFHDYCWECLHKKIIPKDLGCLDVDLIRRIQRIFKKKIYEKRRKEIVWGLQWMFWQVFETFQYYTKFQNKFWFQIYELESNKKIKMAQCMHLSPPHWAKSIVLTHRQWIFFVCLSFQQQGSKKISDIYKYFEINAQLKIFKLQKSFHIYLSVIYIQKMWRIILKRWYYRRLEKFMKKVDCIYVNNKKSCLCIGFDLKVNQLSFETLRISGLSQGKQRHWTLHVENGKPLSLKYLQCRKGNNFQIASQKIMRLKKTYHVGILIQGSDIMNQYQVQIYINGQMEKMMGQIPDIKIPTFIEIIGGETTNQIATTKEVTQQEIQDMYTYKTFFHEQIQQIIEEKQQQQRRVSEPDFESTLNQYQINYHTFKPILGNLQDVVKMCQIISPQISEGNSQLPLFCLHHLFSIQDISTHEKYVIEFFRFMQILNLLNIYIEAQEIYDLALKFQAYKEYNVTQQAMDHLLCQKDLDDFAVLKCQKIVGENNHLTFQNVIVDHLGQFERKIKIQCIIYDKFLINLQKIMYPALESERYFLEPDISILQQEFQIDVIRQVCPQDECTHLERASTQFTESIQKASKSDKKNQCPLDLRFEEFASMLKHIFPYCTIIENQYTPSKRDQFDIFIRTPYNLEFNNRNKVLVKRSKNFDMNNRHNNSCISVEPAEEVQEFEFFNMKLLNKLIFLYRKNVSVEDFFKSFPVKMLQVYDSIAFLLYLYPDLGKIQQQPELNSTGNKFISPMKTMQSTSGFKSFRPSGSKKQIK